MMLRLSAALILLAAAAPGPSYAGPVAATGADAALWGAQIDALAAQGNLRLADSQADADFPGRRVARYDQHHRGVPVFGAQLVRHVGERGETLAVFGRTVDVPSLDVAPVLGASEAAAIAAAQAGGSPLGTPTLVVLPASDAPVLTWMLWTRDGIPLQRHFVDARTGRVVWSYSDLRTTAAVGRGVGVWGDQKKMSASVGGPGFRASDELRPTQIVTYDVRFTPGVLNEMLRSGRIDDSFVAGDADNDWADGAVVDGHTYAGWSYDYLFKRHGRRGIDGADRRVRVVTHFATPQQRYLNAFWDPVSHSMSFGDGDSVTYREFSSALDVVGHELMHGVSDHTWRPIYFGESGALDEALSDIVGTGVEFFNQPAGNGRLLADYAIGEDLAIQFDHAGAFRLMDDPGRICVPIYGCDPDHYSKRYLGQGDNGGIHGNCAIANQAFWLLVEGGTNRTSGIRVSGIGAARRDRAEKIFFRGFTAYLTSAATFSAARLATIQAARDLYGASSEEAAQMAAAWTAVGVE